MIFAQMCSFYHQGKLSSPQTGSVKQNLDSIKVNTSGISCKGEKKNPRSCSDAVLGQVWVGSIHEAICIPTNSMKVLQGRTSKITQRLSCMVEARECNNLPLGLVVNRTMVTPNKSKRVPIVLVNTYLYNVWVRQPLLAADIIEAEDCPWDYQLVMFHDSNNIKVSFCPVPTLKFRQRSWLLVCLTVPKQTIQHRISQKKKNKARDLSLGLDPSSMIPTLISRKNLVNFHFP